MLVCTSALLAIAALAQAATINVPADQPTIQDAINAANPGGGDTITVDAGTYAGFTVDRPVIITGAGSGSVTVNGSANLASSDVTIEGMRFEPSGGNGVNISSQTISNITLRDVVAANSNNNGVHVQGTSRVTNMVVEDCQFIDNNGRGFRISSQAGIDGFQMTGTLIEGNNIGFYVASDDPAPGSPSESFLRNAVISGNTFGDNDTRCFYAEELNNVTIEENTFDGSLLAIQVFKAWLGDDLRGIVIRRNAFANHSAYAMRFQIYGETFIGDPLTDVFENLEIFENTVVNCGRAVWFDTDPSRTGIETIHINRNSFLVNDFSVQGICFEAGETWVLDLSANWWGTSNPADFTVDPDVFADPACSVTPRSAFDFTPMLESGVDTDPGTPGFQPDLTSLTVHSDGGQTGAPGRIQEGVDLVTASTVNIMPGLYNENVLIDKKVALLGSGSGSNPVVDTIITQDPAGAGDTKIGVIQLDASGDSLADPIAIRDLRLEPVGMAGISVGRFTEATATTVDYVELTNVHVVGTQANPATEQERGLYVDNTSTLTNLVIIECAFDQLSYGWYLHKEVSADASTVQFVDVQNTTFNDNRLKGVYAEKLSDATFAYCEARGNGYSSSGVPSYFLPWMAGFDINLKAGMYANLSFECCEITDNALGGAREGVGITVKARDDASSYNTFPASVMNVSIVGGTITGNERGIRFGEPGKSNATPLVVNVNDVNLFGNFKTYGPNDGSAYGDLIDQRDPNADAIDATVNWWGQPGGPVSGQVSNPGTNQPDLSMPLDAPSTSCQATVQLNAVNACLDAGSDTLVVTIDVSNAPEPYVGGQFRLSYDTSKLTFVDAVAVGPFGETFEFVDVVAGTIDHAVNLPSGDPGIQTDNTLAELTFTVDTEVCEVDGLVSFRTDSPPSRLSNFGGDPVPSIFIDLGAITNDNTPPTITCPPDLVIGTDPGLCEGTVDWVQRFDSNPPTAASQAPGVWYVDRYAPAVFESAVFDGDNRLKHGLRAADNQANRPGGFSSDFYNYQGRKWDTNVTAGESFEVDLYVDSTWLPGTRASIWATASDGNLTFPIIEYVVDGDVGGSPFTGFRWWQSGIGWTASSLVNPPMDQWYTLEIKLTATEIEYYVDNTLIGTVSNLGASTFINVILQGHNEGTAGEYDIYWDNLSVGATAPSFDDNCCSLPATYERSDDPLLTLEDPFPIGTTLVTWTATDCCGNQTTCVQEITVEDTEAPTITTGTIDVCYDTVADAEAAALAATSATDKCDVPGDLAFSVATVGTCNAVVTVTVTDQSNNSASVDYSTSIDATAPVIDPIVITGGSFDANCTVEIAVSTTITDDCCLDPNDVTFVYSVTNGFVNPSTLVATQNGANQLLISGVVTVNKVAGACPTEFTLGIDVVDCCGNFTTLESNTVTLTDGTPPTVSAPANISVFADAGACDALVTWPAATVTDNCDTSFNVIYDIDVDNDNSFDVTGATSTSFTFPTGTHRIVASSEDACGNVGTDELFVTVDGSSELLLTIELDDVMITGLTRCITLDLYDANCGTQTVEAEVLFDTMGANGVVGTATVLVPCGNWTCVVARDRLHTLARTLDTPDFGVVGTQFVADFVTAGKPLIGGNFNDDEFIDILDFGVFTAQYNVNYGTGDTTCATVGPHPDASGNGLVFTEDFTFIQTNFFVLSETPCCTVLALENATRKPVAEISVAELRKRGLAELSVADVNNDGWVDQADVTAFFNGAAIDREPRAVAPWFDSAPVSPAGRARGSARP